ITTASSAILLLVAVISLWQVSPELLESYDPETNSLVKLGPGESVTFVIEESEMVTALRISDGETPDSELTLLDDEGSEVTGREKRWSEPNRLGSDEKTIYSPVRVFENLGGSYTLQNHGDGDLWLVDDEVSADKLLGNFWMYLFYIGCCIGSPVGLVGLILAFMVWTDKRKMPDQFVIINNGSVIMDDVQSEGSEVRTSEGPQDEVVDETWKRWDEG
ncbi:MAG: hypothetical protein VX909_04320, partial [Candidatus Thermoplasmatota archaeon]|nr:hypothetical protein [Candidatus Thermoplasmatota archaeon]